MRVTETRADGPARIRRKRTCSADTAHSFWTTETLEQLGDSKALYVDRQIPGELLKPFDADVVKGDLQLGTMKALRDGPELTDLLSQLQVEALISAEPRHVRTVDGEGKRFVVRSEVLRDRLLQLLRSRKSRLPHVLYATLFVGRIDLVRTANDEAPAAQSGWYSARDALAWLWDADGGGGYDDLKHPLPMNTPVATTTVVDRTLHEALEDLAALEGASASQQRLVEKLIKRGFDGDGSRLLQQRRISTREVVQRLVPDQPAVVVKRRSPEPGAGAEGWPTPRPFQQRQLWRSVRTALLGRRPAALEVADARGKEAGASSPLDDLTTLVTLWVLADLEGQAKVTTGQLADRTMRALRRLDDIAYLRYAATAKGMDSVSDFVVEAIGLISHPSQRMRFAADAFDPSYLREQ